jgi:protein O-mannosyl-transferase
MSRKSRRKIVAQVRVPAPLRSGKMVAHAPAPQWRRHAWRLLAIWSFLFIAYSNSFQTGLVFDNASVIGRDPRVRQATAQNIHAILTGAYRYDKPTAGLYRPLTTLSYLLNYAVFANSSRPAGYHRANLALHCANVALVYGLGIAALGETAPAWALAAIWGLHPLLTESVTNIVGRADLLSAFGVLAGLLCHARASSAAGARRLGWLAGIAAAQAIGLFSKESAAVLPAIMLAYDLTWFHRTSWRQRAPAYAALAPAFAAFLHMRNQAHLHMIVPIADNPLVNAGFWTARLTAVKVIGKFLWLYLWPAALSADYSYNAVPLFGSSAWSWDDAKALIALAVCSALALLALILVMRGRSEEKPVLFFLGFFFITLLPTSNLIVFIGSIMAERFLYLPSVGLAGCTIAALYALGRRKPRRRPQNARLAWATLALVCVALGARTYARNSDWKDELSLWTSAVNVSPGSAKAHYNLAKAVEVVPGRLPEAIAQYRESLRIDPHHADVHNNLANALSATPGGLPEAIAEYKAAIRVEPDRAEPHDNLANVLAHIPGRLPEAIAEYRAALRIESNSAELHYNLANALLLQPDGTAEAIDEYRAALRVDPDHADAHINLGNALSAIPGRLPEAVAEYQAALRIRPDGAEAHYDLGTALARMPGRLPDAIGEFQAALRSRPNFVEAHVNLGNALAQTPGRVADALAEYEASLRIRFDPVVREMADRLRAQRQPASFR